ncbi:MAG: precorrin-2 dehydrogenase/sirohydrochlorin ferrochelatase family protein [Shewanella sp.]
MQYFPIMLDTNQLNILVVGGGSVAERKLTLLARTQANIDVISPAITPAIEQLVASKRIQWLAHHAAAGDITHHYQLIYLATDDSEVQQQLAAKAAKLSILVNVVDTPALCSFITPAIVDRGRLQVAISTAGAAPVYARTIRSRLEQALPASLAPLLDFVAEQRGAVKQAFLNEDDRRRCWERFFSLNGDRFDDHTPALFQQALVAKTHALPPLLLLDEQLVPQLLPIAAVPLLQQLEYLFHRGPVALELNELIRRDCHREALIEVSAALSRQRAGYRTMLIADSDTLALAAAQSPHCLTLIAGAVHGT